MSKFFTLAALCCLTISARAQEALIPYQPFGKIDKADLEMTSCGFEKDANAEILIDKAELYYDATFNIVMDCHKRIKIFNNNGKGAANIHIPYYDKEFITGLQAETINLENGTVEVTKLDRKLIYVQNIDKNRKEEVFTMPNVKPGSIIEYKYSYNSPYSDIPTWYFQDKIPVRYSELVTNIPEFFFYSPQTNPGVSLSKHTNSQTSGSIGSGANATAYQIDVECRVMQNIQSLPDEAYMSSAADNLKQVSFHLTSLKIPGDFVHTYSDTWGKVGTILLDHEDFGHQLKRKLTNEDVIVAKATALKTDDEKIAYIFNEVKNTMKWDGRDQWYTNDGTSQAWDKKTGNSTEINLILYHLLKKAGVAALPMVVSTRDHGKVNPAYTFLRQFNRAVVYVPVDSAKHYILDASDKYNIYCETPSNLLNSTGLYVNADKKAYNLLFLKKEGVVAQSILINADIKADGKMEGTAQISSESYHRVNNITRYKTDGETKYMDYLRDDDNNLKISSLKLVNMEDDTLPLMQNLEFKLDLAGSDGTYIYFSPNLFSSIRKNPFLSENRYTDIDFGYCNNISINGSYKIPAGYKVDALPKSMVMMNPDKTISFRRIIAEEDGTIGVRYVVNYKKSIFFKEDYPDLHEFFKQLYEKLNEQIVLKKI